VAQPHPISIYCDQFHEFYLEKELNPITPSAQIQTEETELLVAFSVSKIQKGY